MIKQSESIKELASALSKAQAAIMNVGKTKAGERGQYADLADIILEAKKPLADNNLSITQELCYVIIGDKAEHALATTIMHESGEWRTGTMLLNMQALATTNAGKKPNEAHDFGARVSYCRRYAYGSAVGIAQEDNASNQANRQAYEEEKAVAEGRVISAEQVKRLYTLAAVGKKSNEEAKAILAAHGFSSAKEVSPDLYEAICSQLQSQEVA